MRRIVAILIIIIIAFWMAYGLYAPFRDLVNNLMLQSVGPAVTGAIVSVGTSPFWVQYGSFIMLGAGVIFGIVIYSFWHKTDWRVRRWAASRTASDIGISPVMTHPTQVTPATATTRTTTPPPPPAPSEQKPEEAKE